MTDALFPPNDFLAYWSGFQVFLAQGDPYNHQHLVEYQQSLGFLNSPGPIYYSPILFFLLAPILWLPLPVSQSLWAALNIVLLLGCVVASGRLVGARLKPIEAAVIGIIFPPCALTLIFGQLSALVCLSTLTSIYFITRGRPCLAGIAILPALLKPHLIFLVLIPMALSFKKVNWRFLITTGSSYLLILLLLELFRPGILSSYLNADGKALNWLGHSPITAIRLIFEPTYSKFIAFAPAVVISLAVAMRCFFARLDLTRSAPLLICFSTLLTPYIWIFDFVVLLPAAIQIYVRGRPAQQLLALIAGGWWVYGVSLGFDWRSFIFSVAITVSASFFMRKALACTPHH
jgi:hypothetical protein